MPGYSYTSSPGWTARRQRILKRDNGICYICGLPGADRVDAIIGEAEGGSHTDDTNLAAIHQEPCHTAKTRTEIAAGKARMPRRNRQPEPHPGLIS